MEPAVPAAADRTADPLANILLVDDRADKLLALEAVLSGAGRRLVTASSGEEALRCLLRDEFAVILLDVKMPDLDGFETAQLIRQRPRSEHTPIIFVTAYADNDRAMVRGYGLGAVDFIFTPVIPEVLRSKVAVFIDLFTKTREVRRQGDLLRAAAEARAELSEQRLSDLLTRLDVGVFRSTIEGRVIEANPAFHHLLLLDPRQDAELDMRQLYVDPTERDRAVAELLEKGTTHNRAARLRRGDGSEIWVSLTKTLAAAVDGHPGIDGLMEDITHFKQAEEELARKAEELARSNAHLEQFAYSASHDLQEPLRMISSYTSLLARRYQDQLDDKALEYLHFAIDVATRMQTLITDILAFARVERHERVPSPVDCNQIFDRALFNLDMLKAENGATVTRDPLPTVLGDDVLLGQLFQNLIGNGIKFSDKKTSPKVHVGARDLGTGQWEFSVSDNGIGIPAEYHDRIFGIFQRLHTRQEYPGTGIGLALCRRVVEIHGGRIWVESEPGHGATFRFTLPGSLAPAATNAEAATLSK